MFLCRSAGTQPKYIHIHLVGPGAGGWSEVDFLQLFSIGTASPAAGPWHGGRGGRSNREKLLKIDLRPPTGPRPDQVYVYIFRLRSRSSAWLARRRDLYENMGELMKELRGRPEMGSGGRAGSLETIFGLTLR
jgi:hypothetical protein